MVKSVVKAMDALQAFAREEWKVEVKRFVISGASKRGWTTWLTAATQDPRVVAIAPMVIDTLNMQDQMAHQKRSFGDYSEMIRDYTARNLVPLPPGEDAKKLWGMVDPYFYRDRMTLPKLMILGNNDRYWTVDALNLYWDGLKGDRYVTYVPNAGHNLVQKGVEEGKERAKMLNALSAFSRAQVANKPLPKLSWKHDDVDGKMRLTVEATPAPKGARLWAATSKNRDFRESTWKDQPAKVEKGTVVGLMSPPQEGCLAFYAELDYEIDGIPYTLCTQIRVAEAKK
jgi:PhoPQ-activated pathogenicity-related protein